MVNYGKGKIYKLVNDVDNKIYIGSTTNPLCKRKGEHKKSSKFEKMKVYQHLNVIGWENVHIVLIENYPCTSKEELFSRERYWMEQLKSELNVRLPIITSDERQQNQKKARKNWNMKNINHVKAYKIKYDNEHPDKTKARVELRAQRCHCICGGKHTHQHVSEHRKSQKHIKFMSQQKIWLNNQRIEIERELTDIKQQWEKFFVPRPN